MPSLSEQNSEARQKIEVNDPFALGLETTVTSKEPGAVVYEMWLPIKDPGEYRWTFRCPTRAFVRVWDIGLLDADFDYVPGSTQTATLRLGKGIHPVRITVLTDSKNNAAFVWNCKKADIK